VVDDESKPISIENNSINNKNIVLNSNLNVDDKLNSKVLTCDDEVYDISEDDKSDVEDNNNDINADVKLLWYHKIQFLVEHVRVISQSFVFQLGTYLAIDEMMIKYSGRSKETIRIKNKPIKEGFKLFVLATYQGYVVNFTPEGRFASNNDSNEYTITGGKIESMITFLSSVVISLKNKQEQRIKDSQSLHGTRFYYTNNPKEILQDKFIIAMDNYFTLPIVMKQLRAIGIGVVGTARGRIGWPHPLLAGLTNNSTKFNYFYWYVDINGTLIAKWKDNGLVFLVSAVHSVGTVILKKQTSSQSN
jgi:hypothetical protein